MIVELTLAEALERAKPPLRTKMIASAELLRKAEKLALKYDAENGYFLAFSGGKDSQALYHIAQLAGVRFKGHFSPTTVDPAPLIRFIKTQYPEVEIIPPKESIYTTTLRKGIFPTRMLRWCCAEFKEKHGANTVMLTGVRRAESIKRSKRNQIEVSSHKFSGDLNGFAQWQDEKMQKQITQQRDQFSTPQEQEVRCISGKDKIIVNPILDWSDADVWEFLNNVVRVPHCELYDNGAHRIGCILCPMASRKSKAQDIKHFPHIRNRWVQTIEKLIRMNKLSMSVHSISPVFGYPPQLQLLTDAQIRHIAEEIFEWWISGVNFKQWHTEQYSPRLNFD